MAGAMPARSAVDVHEQLDQFEEDVVAIENGLVQLPWDLPSRDSSAPITESLPSEGEADAEQGRQSLSDSLHDEPVQSLSPPDLDACMENQREPLHNFMLRPKRAPAYERANESAPCNMMGAKRQRREEWAHGVTADDEEPDMLTSRRQHSDSVCNSQQAVTLPALQHATSEEKKMESTCSTQNIFSAGQSSCTETDESGSQEATPGAVSTEIRKGVPWTNEEHRLFLNGLDEYGKGDWRNISKFYVQTRTPTQVASHAQVCCSQASAYFPIVFIPVFYSLLFALFLHV